MLPFFPGVFLVGVYWLVLLFLSMSPPGADETGYAFGMFALLLLTIPSELVALGLGVAGVFQRTRKRSFALLGVACSVLFLALIETQVRFADVASFIVGMTEPQPVTHSPGNK
ncbi:MAG: hypothetical protein M3Q54_03190 [Actinomycetota bacterium]|nr:hypothetical protein [Rubrobacter sp.]MDQ3236528.1 hypothetical protein [Actinomycetota bacterium]